MSFTLMQKQETSPILNSIVARQVIKYYELMSDKRCSFPRNCSIGFCINTKMKEPLMIANGLCV